MPKVSEFFGIAIYFFFNEHGPPHFHAYYSGATAMIAIEDLRVLRGQLPPRAMGLVVEWASLRREELRRAWAQANSNRSVDPIEPLK